MQDQYPDFMPSVIDENSQHPNQEKRRNGAEINRIASGDQPVHDWYRFVLSYPPHLVRTYLKAFGATENHIVLDPFCGTGTTIVEAKKLGIPSVGIESVPLAQFAASVKTSWDVNPSGLLRHARQLATRYCDETEAEIEPAPSKHLKSGSLTASDLADEKRKLLLKNSISERPLRKALTLLDVIRNEGHPKYQNYQLLALATALVKDISNLRFGPEVGIGKIKSDSRVLDPWMQRVKQIVDDLQQVQDKKGTPSEVIWGDAREVECLLPDNSVDFVVTSPPYPNEKDYTRTTRLESVLLGFINSKEDLRSSKKMLVRSNTRGVYKGDDDDKWILNNEKVNEIAERIESRRIELGKSSGFERLYHRVTKLYFGGMAKHLEGLKRVLKPGAKLAYVVGDQASYLRVMIHTGQLLAEIGQDLGYDVLGIDLFRTRAATATRSLLREEVVVLQWNGNKNGKRQ